MHYRKDLSNWINFFQVGPLELFGVSCRVYVSINEIARSTDLKHISVSNFISVSFEYAPFCSPILISLV